MRVVEWWVIIRKLNNQCPYFEAEDDSCFILSDSEDEPTACEKTDCPLIDPDSR